MADDDARLREVETKIAILWEWRAEVITRSRQIPGWLFSAVGLALTLIGLVISLLLSGRLSWT